MLGNTTFKLCPVLFLYSLYVADIVKNEIQKEIKQELNCYLPDITPHCLRHTHASTLLSKGIPIKYVSKRLGHRNQKTTLDIYDHVLQADKKNAIQILNTFY